MQSSIGYSDSFGGFWCKRQKEWEMTHNVAKMKEMLDFQEKPMQHKQK